MPVSGKENSGREQKVRDNLRALDVASLEIERYGVHPDQFIEWYGPEGGKVVCFVHGGFFHEDGTLSYLRPAAFALGEAGYRVALVEYRRIAGNTSATMEDMSVLTRHRRLRGATWLGHSAGSIPVLNVLFDPDLAPSHAVVLAPIFDLRRDVEEFKDTAKSDLARWVGGSPQQVPNAYADFDSAVAYARLGADGFSSRGYRLDVIHGALDETIPVQRSRDLAAEPFNVAIVAEANHNDVICPGHDAWILLLGALG